MQPKVSLPDSFLCNLPIGFGTYSVAHFAREKRSKAAYILRKASKSPSDSLHRVVLIFVKTFSIQLFTILCKPFVPSLLCSAIFSYLPLLWWKRQSLQQLLSNWEQKEDLRDFQKKCCFLSFFIPQSISYCLL